MCNQCLSPLKLWVRTRFKASCTPAKIYNGMISNVCIRYLSHETALSFFLRLIGQCRQYYRSSFITMNIYTCIGHGHIFNKLHCLWSNDIRQYYILHGHQLEQVQSAKYLGVSITSDMKWSEHIANICKKANNTLSFLKRNLNISNSNLKEKTYQSLVRPTMEYACTTWDPYQQNNKHRIEMV